MRLPDRGAEVSRGQIRYVQSAYSIGTLARKGRNSRARTSRERHIEGPNGPRKGLNGAASRTHDSWTVSSRKSRWNWPSVSDDEFGDDSDGGVPVVDSAF